MTSEGNRPVVIIADDHASIHPLLRRILEPEFDVVASVFDGQALLTATASFKPDLIIVDVFMPVLGGIEAVERLDLETSTIAVVFISTDGGQHTRQRALRAGALGFVQKALAAEDLIPAARAALNGEQFLSKPSEDES